MADIMPESQICRTCLKCKNADEMISVFFKSCDDENSLAQMLKVFTATKVCLLLLFNKTLISIKKKKNISD